MKKSLLLSVVALGLASFAFAGDTTDKPACNCGAKSVEECHKHCGDKCDCAKQHCDAPKPEPKK